MAPDRDPVAGRLTDCHVHLDHFPDEERARVLERSRAVGVRFVVTAGMDVESSAKAVALAGSHGGVLAAVGVHPWNADKAALDFADALRGHAGRPGLVAIAEAGLDFVDNVFTGVTYHDHPALRATQERVLRDQIALACDLGLPLVLHGRGAYGRLLGILKEERADRVGGAVHNFDTDVPTARALFRLGFLASFGGSITFPTETRLHALVRAVPLDRILLETDSPYMPLHEQVGERNEPANVARVAQAVANLKGVSRDALAERTFENFTTLFHVSA